MILFEFGGNCYELFHIALYSSMVVSDPFPQPIISFLHFSTVRKFRNMRKKIAKKSNWFSRESICLCLGLLFLSPPGAAPLRQSRCSMKAKSSSSSSNEILVAWVTRPNRPKGVKDVIKQISFPKPFHISHCCDW